MAVFESIRRFNERSHVYSMRALRLLQPFMFATAAAFHVLMLSLTSASRLVSAVPLVVRCVLLCFSVLGLVAALRSHAMVRRGADAITRIKGFLAVLALSGVAIAIYLEIGWEILQQ